MKQKKYLVLFLNFIIIGMFMITRCFSENLKVWQKVAKDYKQTKWLLNAWLKKMIDGKRVADYIDEKGYKKVAIYGMGDIGKLLLQDLKNSGLEVIYGIDRNAANISCEIPVFSVNQEREDVDLIIVTPFHYIDEIKGQLTKDSKAEIKAIDDILYSLGQESNI